MKSLSVILSAAGLAVGLALVPAMAQAPKHPAPAAPAAPALKPGSPTAIAAAKEILTMKNAPAMYANAVPNLVEQTKNTLLQSNLNLQKDLNEVAVIVALVAHAQAQRGPATPQMRGDGPSPEAKPFSITKADAALDDIIAPDAKLVELANGFGLTDGKGKDAGEP